MKRLYHSLIIIYFLSGISLCSMVNKVSRIVLVVQEIVNVQKTKKIAKPVPARTTFIPKKSTYNTLQLDQAKQKLIDVERDLKLDRDFEGLALYAKYKEKRFEDALELYQAETKYLNFLFKDQALELYANISGQYPELFRFIQEYQCHMSSQDLQKNYVLKKGTDMSVAIERIINAARAKQVIYKHKLTHIDVPHKCLVVQDGEFLCYAQKIINIAANHNPTSEEKAQFDRFVTLTGYSDFAEKGNFLYDAKAKKYFFVDLEDNSFRGSNSLKYNSSYDPKGLNLQEVKDQATVYARVMSSLKHNFFWDKSHEIKDIKRAIDLVYGGQQF